MLTNKTPQRVKDWNAQELAEKIRKEVNFAQLMNKDCVEEDPGNYFTEVMGTGGEVVETAAFGLK